MKKTIILLALALLIGATNSWATAILQTTDWLHEPVICLDSANGTPIVADSAHVHVFFGNATDPCYSARITTIPSSWIDSYDYAGSAHDAFWFLDQVADIDADSGAGNYTVNVRMFDEGVPTDNIFSFQIVTEELDATLRKTYHLRGDLIEYTDTLKTIYVATWGNETNDGLNPWSPVCSLSTANHLCTGALVYRILVAPGSYASQCCTLDVANTELRCTDPPNCIINGVSNQDLIRVDVSSGGGVKISGFTLKPDMGAFEGDAICVATCDGFEIANNRMVSSIAGAHIDNTGINGKIHDNYMFDGKYDGIRCEGSRILIYDNVIDSIQGSGADGIALWDWADNNIVYRNLVKDNESASEIFLVEDDSSYHNWFVNNYAWSPTSAEQYQLQGDASSAVNAFTANHGRGEISVLNTAQEDIDQSPRSANFDSGLTASAADNFETMLDGTGGQKFSIASLEIRASGNDTALIAIGAGSGHGSYVQGGATGHGAYYRAAGTGKYGFYSLATGTGGHGGTFKSEGGASSGLYIDGANNGLDCRALAGHGAYFEADAEAGAYFKGGGSTHGDIHLGMDGRIRGTVDRCTFVDSVDTIIHPSWNWVTPDNGFGIVDTISTTTITRDSTNFATMGDNVWNGMFLQFTAGQNKGLTRLIEDFGNYGEFTLYPALPYAPAVNDEFRIMSLVVGERKEGGIVRIYER